MDAHEATSSILGVIEVASRTLSQLYKYISVWTFAPTEVIQLRDGVVSLRELL